MCNKSFVIHLLPSHLTLLGRSSLRSNLRSYSFSFMRSIKYSTKRFLFLFTMNLFNQTFMTFSRALLYIVSRTILSICHHQILIFKIFLLANTLKSVPLHPSKQYLHINKTIHRYPSKNSVYILRSSISQFPITYFYYKFHFHS
jgi:hypothetical protein